MTAELLGAIAAYFEGERQEMYAILAGSMALVLLAGALNLAGKDGFARGFGATALLVALALSATAASLLVRDPPHHAMLVAGVRGPDAAALLAREAARMVDVLSRYPLYRLAALGLGLAALLAAALSRRGWVNGAAAGVLLLAAAQLTIDHYSEARARRYAERLDAAIAAGAERAR
jgi:hypothetical protein